MPSVLSKYSEQIKHATEAFSYGRDLFAVWTSIKISFLGMVMTKPDFYYYLVENEFIINDFVVCNLCHGKMT